ncbi:MAG: fatty acid desaturase [Bifidobacteriaceae bacterium]|jgi:fatty acid desaturase|nr:fatty acid desaturase [Bifidobacteriaceae bacterium]
MRHHAGFGTKNDPDFVRFKEMAIDRIDRTRPLEYISSFFRNLGPYLSGWGQTTGKPSNRWPVSVLPTMAALGAWLGGRRGAAVWAGVAQMATARWAVLPFVRFLAETSEHHYEGRETVADATISNIDPGQRLFLHPHGDGFHTLHHIWPGIPHHRMSSAHQELIHHDYGRECRAGLRTRKNLFSADWRAFPDA